jgi:tetratricopeptide (TPR) repeat protein
MWEGALARTQDELARDAADPFHWFNLGTDLVALGRYPEAADAYDRARQLGLPWRMLWYQFGPFPAYYGVGRYHEVVALADATLRITTHVEELHYWRGMALAALGDTRAARTSLERALQLSEAMMARGFAGDNHTLRRSRTRLALLAGMVLVLTGWLASMMRGWQNAGAAAASIGAIIIFLSLWLTGRRIHRSTYRKENWNLHSGAIVLGSALTSMGLLLPLPIISYDTLTYNPYPSLNLPAFDPFIGILLLGLLTPALVTGVKRS